MRPVLTGYDKMKKYLYFLLTLCLSGMLLVGCNLPKPDPDDPTEETENPKAGDDGYWCWKVTTTIPMEGTDDFVTAYETSFYA